MAYDGPSTQIIVSPVGNSRSLYFKIERLDKDENVLETLTPKLLNGSVTVSYDDINRRKCSFELAQTLPSDWMSSRWKLYYGQLNNNVVQYTSLGVFIPVNPKVEEENGGDVTSFQGFDKAQILADAYSEIPLTFTSGTTLKAVLTSILDMVSVTKRNLEDVPFSLATDFTFDEGVSLEHIASTLIRSFPADWYFDRDGYARLVQLPAAAYRPVRQVYTEDANSILIESSYQIDSDKYWNKVIVVGGRVDTGIFRQVYSSDVEFTRAGRWIAKFFKEDAATSQQQVNDLATQYLAIGTQLPKTIQIKGLPLADLEPKEVIQKDGVKYEIIRFNIPLGLDLQEIEAGEII